MTLPEKGYTRLRRFRHSACEASYFVTICLRQGESSLAVPDLFSRMMKTARQMEAESIWQLRVLTLMPNHLHLIFRIVSGHSFAEIVRLFKGRSSVPLRNGGLHWQKGGVFEHRLRADDPLAAVFRYVFMNPYRKNLIPPDQKWPFFYCSEADWTWFQHEINSECPFPEWL